MRLIDVDAFKSEWGMSNDCTECKQNWRSCQYEHNYTRADFCGWLDDAPTIEPERKTGKWEEVEVTWLADVEDQPDAIASMFCPECRHFANHVYHYGDPRYGMFYCPWCGAKKEGGDAK